MLSAFCYALGYTVGAIAFFWMARRRGLATQGVYLIVMAALVGGLAAANLSQRILLDSPGKTVLGGIAGGYLVVILVKKWIGLTRPLGDLFAVAICAGEAVGRWGCYYGGCCYGKPCGLPWAIWQHHAFRHPTQLYHSLAAAVILVILLRLDRLSLPENTLFFVQGLLYCCARFVIEFYRDVATAAWGLTVAQWACIAGILFFGWKLTQSRRMAVVPAASVNLRIMPTVAGEFP